MVVQGKAFSPLATMVTIVRFIPKMMSGNSSSEQHYQHQLKTENAKKLMKLKLEEQVKKRIKVSDHDRETTEQNHE